MWIKEMTTTPNHVKISVRNKEPTCGKNNHTTVECNNIIYIESSFVFVGMTEEVTTGERVELEIKEDVQASPEPNATTNSLLKNNINTDYPIFLEWRDLRYKVADREDKKKMKTILKGLNGCATPGQLVAVIGPSGSGKSSFLNCIAARNQIGVTGDILYNGVTRPANAARFTGYVTQDDIYFESLTVRETIAFAAGLKLPTTTSKEDKNNRIDYVINELDLKDCQNTKVGQVGKGISGGERRRLAIALEILNEPSLLLLDEPTSGLDSASALMVGKILKRLATNKSLTIIATIHQPRYALAQLFDKLYFLAQGEEIYFGPSVPKCLSFFENAGYPCPEYDNPADFLLDLVNTSDNNNSNDEKNDERLVVVEKLTKAYQSSEYRLDATKYELPSKFEGSKLFNSLGDGDFYITPLYNQIWIVMIRSFLHKFREPIAMLTQAFNSFLIPLLFGSVYFQMDKSQQGAFDRTNAISLIVLMSSFLAFDVLILFPSEREIFNREQSSGMYRPIAFYIGRTMSEFPQHVLFGFVMATISYFMYGLQTDGEKYLNFVALIVLETSAGAGLLYLFSAASANLEQSNLLATVFLLLFMLFDGNWISIDKIPVIWVWVPHISFMGYAGQACMANEYRGLRFRCSDKETENGNCFYHKGSEILYQRGIEDVNIAFNMGMLVVMNILYRSLAFLCVWLFYRPFPPLYILKTTFGFNKTEKKLADLDEFKNNIDD